MNGTSSATPGAAGVVALMLGANPDLGWRDVRIILALTSRINDQSDPDWTGGATPPYSFNHQYGFGVVDANLAVATAKNWTNVPAAAVPYTTPAYAVDKSIPDDDIVNGVSDTQTVSGSGINYIEWVEITFTATNSPYSGDLDVTLTSPNNAVSHLAVPHLCEGTSGGCTTTYAAGWVFGSARHLGEAANGVWKLTVKDGYQGGTGKLVSWNLKFYGH
jgi:kexin